MMNSDDKKAIMKTYGSVRGQPYGRYDLWSSDGNRNNFYGSIDDMYEHIGELFMRVVNGIENERRR